MAITEVFSNPTVKRVIFQATFPSLFTMESLVGQYQLKIMDRFPYSSLIYSRQIVFAQMSPQDGESVLKPEAKPEVSQGEPSERIWSFKSDVGVEITVASSFIALSSGSHKTYNNQSSSIRFRDAIQHAVGNFLSIVRVPKLTRVGLRYIDECPVPVAPIQFAEFYNSALAIDRFPLAEAETMAFVVVAKRGQYGLRYAETLLGNGTDRKLRMDFDGFAQAVGAEDYLRVTDELHDLVIAEYQRSVKEPLYEHMRSGG